MSATTPGGAAPRGTPRASVWLRGPVEGIPAALQHAAHALLQSGEELEEAVAPLTTAQLWDRPGGAASVAFHLRHIAGSTDRLLTYARGEALSDVQRQELMREQAPVIAGDDARSLLDRVQQRIESAIEAMRTTPDSELHAPRVVGRAALPSTVMGLLYHVADHAQRHTGQVIATAKILRGRSAPPPG